MENKLKIAIEIKSGSNLYDAKFINEDTNETLANFKIAPIQAENLKKAGFLETAANLLSGTFTKG